MLSETLFCARYGDRIRAPHELHKLHEACHKNRNRRSPGTIGQTTVGVCTSSLSSAIPDPRHFTGSGRQPFCEYSAACMRAFIQSQIWQGKRERWSLRAGIQVEFKNALLILRCDREIDRRSAENTREWRNSMSARDHLLQAWRSNTATNARTTRTRPMRQRPRARAPASQDDRPTTCRHKCREHGPKPYLS